MQVLSWRVAKLRHADTDLDASIVMKSGQVETCRHWFVDHCLGMGWIWPSWIGQGMFRYVFYVVFSISLFFFELFLICLGLFSVAQERLRPRKTYRNQKKPCINEWMYLISFRWEWWDFQGAVHQQCKNLLNQQEGPDWEEWTAAGTWWKSLVGALRSSDWNRSGAQGKWKKYSVEFSGI